MRGAQGEERPVLGTVRYLAEENAVNIQTLTFGDLYGKDPREDKKIPQTADILDLL